MELEIEMETKEGEFLVFRTKTWRKVRVVDGDRVLTTILHDENSIIYDTTYEKIEEAFMDASIMLNLLRLMLGISDEEYLQVASKRLKELRNYTLRVNQEGD